MAHAPDEIEILEESLSCLEGHRKKAGDESTLHTFNRLLAKRFRADPWLVRAYNSRSTTKINAKEVTPQDRLDFDRSQIRSRRAYWPTAILAALKTTSRIGSSKAKGPIIVVEYLQSLQFLDGNGRVNYWISIGNNEPHVVHVHTIQDVGGLVPNLGKG